MPKMNQKYKDTVFSDLFYTDRDAKINDLSLYNALHDTNLTDPEEVKLMRLENTLFMNFYNDVAFSVKDQRIILSEHQSTINYNLPLRELIYIAREYEQYFPTSVRYKKKPVKIPTPEFVTFYNGRDEFPVEMTMRLSDSFIVREESPMLDLTVKVININPGKNHWILGKCEVLREYSYFVEETRKYGNNRDALANAVNDCMRKGILEDYLSRRGKEAVNMLIAEYDYNEDIRVQREEAVEDVVERLKETEKEADSARKEADEQKLARMMTVKKMYDRGDSIIDIAEMTGYTPEKVREILNMNLF